MRVPRPASDAPGRDPSPTPVRDGNGEGVAMATNRTAAAVRVGCYVVRRAKIVCTLGPATSSAESILRLVEAGMDVARFNLSHGKHSEHEQVYRNVRAANRRHRSRVGCWSTSKARRSGWEPSAMDPSTSAVVRLSPSQQLTWWAITSAAPPPTRACRVTSRWATPSSSTMGEWPCA